METNAASGAGLGGRRGEMCMHVNDAAAMMAEGTRRWRKARRNQKSSLSFRSAL